MSEIKSLLSTTMNPQSRLLEETRGLVKKWDQTGLLEGLNNSTEKSGVAVLLENQAKQLIDEATATGTDSNSEQWAGVALPLVRRIFAEVASKEFVSVQPMNLPSGLVFYLDFKYDSPQLANMRNAFSGFSVFGGNSTKLGSTDQAVNGLYGQGRFGYSINDVSASLSGGNVTVASASFKDAGFIAELSASAAADELKKVTVNLASSDSKFDTEGVRAFTVSGSGIVEYFPGLTTTDDTNVTFLVSASADPTAVVVEYHKQPTDQSRGDFEDKGVKSAATDTGLNKDIGIPEINLEVKSEPIVAKTRKLKAVWTPEMAQDLNAYHSIDADAELTALLSEHVSMEIDLEIIDMLLTNAPAETTEYWSAVIGNEYNAGVNGFVNNTTAANASAYNKQTWFQTLGTKLQKVSNKIHQLTLRGGANFVVASPNVCTILESIPGYNVTAEKDARQFAMGVSNVGAINNRYTVYKNPYMTDNQVLVGFRGNNFMETGAVYAPYIPLIQTPVVYDPVNFTPRKGVLTRYAKKMVRPEFYGKIFIGDLDAV